MIPPIVITWDGIVFAGAVITALGAIFGVLYKIYKMVKGDRENANYCRLWTLRQAIFDEHFPVEDRLEAFDRYEAMGGNGYTREYVERVLRPLLADKVEHKTKEVAS